MTLSTLPSGGLSTADPFTMNGAQLTRPQQLTGRDQFERMGKWLELFMATAEVAKVLARTAFVPEPMRGQPEDIAAAMMKALELGIDPLDGLSAMHVVKGKIGFSAEFMRRRIIEAGHEIEFDETTDDRCKIRGRRAGAEKWQTVTFTSEQARKAKINLGDYPADKLVARASSRMCRRVFPDVLAGAVIVEDILDGEIIEGTFEAPAAAPSSSQPTLQRKPRKSSKPAPEPQPEPKPEPPTGDLDGFPGMDESGYDDTDTGEVLGKDDEPGPPHNTVITEQFEGTDHAGIVPADEPELIRPAQLKKLVILLREAGFGDDDRQARLDYCAAAIGRGITSSKDLTVAEASRIIDTLETGEPQD